MKYLNMINYFKSKIFCVV